jgi:hypothetical protein
LMVLILVNLKILKIKYFIIVTLAKMQHAVKMYGKENLSVSSKFKILQNIKANLGINKTVFG